MEVRQHELLVALPLLAQLARRGALGKGSHARVHLLEEAHERLVVGGELGRQVDALGHERRKLGVLVGVVVVDVLEVAAPPSLERGDLPRRERLVVERVEHVLEDGDLTADRIVRERPAVELHGVLPERRLVCREGGAVDLVVRRGHVDRGRAQASERGLREGHPGEGVQEGHHGHGFHKLG